MSHTMIYPFSDILFRQWALGATSYQCHVHVDVWCIMCPHWAPGAPMFQNSLHLAILDVPGPLWAIGATTWTTSRSIHFQTFMSPLSPGSHLISMSYTHSRSMHYVSPLSPGSHQASTSFTFSYFGRSGSLRAIGATIWFKSRSIHFQTFFVPNEPWEPLYIMSCTSSRSMCYVSPLSPGANIFHPPVHLAIPCGLGLQWGIGATIWNTSRSSHLRTFCVSNDPWKPLYIDAMYN